MGECEVGGVSGIDHLTNLESFFFSFVLLGHWKLKRVEQ